MNSGRKRMASPSTTSRSRSVTPTPSERGSPRPSALRLALLGFKDADRYPVPELSPFPPSARLHGIQIPATPGGSRNIKLETVPVEQTPGGSLNIKLETVPVEQTHDGSLNIKFEPMEQTLGDPLNFTLDTVPIEQTPGGSLNIKLESVPVEQSLGGRILFVDTNPAVPFFSDVVERVNMSEPEAELLEEAPWHVRRWVQDLPGPADDDNKSTSSVSYTPSVKSEVDVTITEVEVRPSTSGLTARSKRSTRCEVVNGSDLDSECDDELDVSEVMSDSSWNDISDTEELEEPMQEIVKEIDTGMDDAADRLLGTSSSFKWVSGFKSFRGIREEFSGPTPGPLKDYDSPYDAFIDIWDKDIIELIALETNRYARQTIETMRARGTLKPSSRLHSWTDTNVEEIMFLFAIYIYMSLDPRPFLTEYWTQNEVLQIPGFRCLMSYNRYVLLSKFLHFVDNTAVASQSPQTGDAYSVRLSAKLGKLTPIFQHLGKKFKSLYNLGPDISIDESLTWVKGRLPWVQTRSKAARLGIRSYELFESKTGYMSEFQISTGNIDSSGGDHSLGVHLGRESTKVVLKLLQGLEHRGHCVVMDKFYNSPSLARYLKSLGFDCFGTLRASRRNVPSDIAKVPKKVSKGKIISRHCGDVSIIAFMDSKMVNIISTYHRPNTYSVTKAGKTVVKPVCVRDYNTAMGGVDLKDQKLTMYLLERKRGEKWYVKMFKRLLNVSIHNALVMYVSSLKRRGKRPVTYREFRYELAEVLVRWHRPSPPKFNQVVGDLMRLRRDIVHEPEHLKGQQFRKRCVICYRMKKNKSVHTKCVQCDVHLCYVNCWHIWHSVAELPGEDIRGRKKRRT